MLPQTPCSTRIYTRIQTKHMNSQDTSVCPCNPKLRKENQNPV
jgi:hypothetical protein